ncbi:MAG: (2Fe-2S)-binding protein [Actinomycetota bacterium]|nr:(2Fe-2S)-binding protein [Actinomycetota bacterium]
MAEALPYLRAITGEPADVVRPGEEVSDGRWFCCEELLGGPSWLGAVVRDSGRRLGAPGGTVAASLFVHGYAYRALTVALSCFFLGGVLPGSRPDEMAMSLSKGRPASVAYRAPRVLATGQWRPGDGGEEVVAAFVDDAVEGHMRPLVSATLSCVRVGRRLLWGNIAASAAVAFRTMEGLLGAEVKPLGERFFALAPAELQGLGNFATVEHAGRSAWYWERRNCCLYDRLPGNVRCTDCSKTSPEERRAAYRAALDKALLGSGGGAG